MQWNELAPGAVMRLRPHRQVDLPKSVLLLCKDSPGWAAVPRHQTDFLGQIDGMDVGRIPAQNIEGLRNTLGQLFQAGLLSIDGQTGLSGSSECGCSERSAVTDDRDEPESRLTSAQAPPDLPNTLLIKLTGACNWSCTYCYDYDRNRFRKSLRLEDVANTIANIIAYHHRIAIMFHGGEPLLQYAELKRIVEFTNRRCHELGGKARFSLQTNGALITEDIIEFLDEHCFDIGMSLDGPPEINDLTRVDHRGRGTAAAIEGLFARQHEFMTSRVGIITTVTSKNVERLSEVASYVRELGVRSWKTAIFDTEGRGTAHPELCPSTVPYVDFLRQWLCECDEGLWDGFRFKNILELIDTIASPKRPNMCLKFPCGAGREFMVVSADRDVMACDATYHPSFALGNTSDDLASVQKSAKAQALFEREAWLLTEAECATCPWLHYCAGTCMAKALIQHGTVKAVDDFECTVRKAIFPILFEKVVDPQSRLRSYYNANRQIARAERL